MLSLVFHSLSVPDCKIKETDSISNFGGAVHPGYFLPDDAIENGNTFHFAAVTDLEKMSAISMMDGHPSGRFKSILLPGTITRGSDNKYSVRFGNTRELVSRLNEGGRGMELSELVLFQNRLLSFDDRTGSVFEVLNQDNGNDSFVVSRYVITEGDGDTDKGMKVEWASEKDGELYIGSIGKEYTDMTGNVVSSNMLWVSIINAEGQLRREDWTDRYHFVQKELGATAPGYVLHEAISWSAHLNKWVFMPRRISSEMYDEVKNEKKGAAKIVLVNEAFTSSEVIDIKFTDNDPLRGFSTLAFVPGSKDRHVLAIRTVEEDCAFGDESLCKQRSYFLVVDVTTGDVLTEEILSPFEPLKFEGVEFVNMGSPERH